MTTLRACLMLALTTVISCGAFPQRMQPDTQQLISQLLTSRFEPTSHNSGTITSQNDEENNDSFNDNNDDGGVSQDDDSLTNSHLAYQGHKQLAKLNPGLLGNSFQGRYEAPTYPLQNGISSEAMARLRLGLWALERLEDRPEDIGASAQGYVEAGKRKRQPHLGFHGSRG